VPAQYMHSSYIEGAVRISTVSRRMLLLLVLVFGVVVWAQIYIWFSDIPTNQFFVLAHSAYRTNVDVSLFDLHPFYMRERVENNTIRAINSYIVGMLTSPTQCTM
jgi:hypothetical protein